jgi:creatinine amidohydrolase
MDASELYDPEFRKLIKSKKQTVIIPVGSLEQHGAHLPITTDSDIVTEIASRLGKKCGFIVFPTINYGVSYEHEPLTNASIKPDNLKNILNDILWSLQDLDAKDKLTYIILNGHHGNAETLSKIEKYFAPDVIVKGKLTASMGNVRVYSYWHFMEHEFDHAGFVETSIMLAISDKVKMEKAKRGLIIEKLSKLEQSTVNKLSTQRGGFPRTTENGVWGDPRDATKKDGRKFLAEIVRNLAKECQT